MIPHCLRLDTHWVARALFLARPSAGKSKDAKGMPLSGRSKNNYRQAIGTLFNYAEARGYLAKGFSKVESVALAKEDEGDNTKPQPKP